MYLYDRKALKSAAKRDLKLIYWQAVLLSLISVAICYVSGYTYVGFIVIYGSMQYGIGMYYTNVIRGSEASIKTLFVGFKRFGETFLLGLLYMVFVFLWSLLFVIPGIVKMYSYSMAFFIQRDNPELSANECLKASMKLTDGHKGKIFMLTLSFIGWCFLIGFVAGFVGGMINGFGYSYGYINANGYVPYFGAAMIVQSLLMMIGSVFLLPYYNMSMARMYDFLILNYNESHANFNTYAGETKAEAQVLSQETNWNSAQKGEEAEEENPFDI